MGQILQLFAKFPAFLCLIAVLVLNRVGVHLPLGVFILEDLWRDHLTMLDRVILEDRLETVLRV